MNTARATPQPTTWHPNPDSLRDGHIIHTRNPIPSAWKQAPAGATTDILTRYTPAQQAVLLAHHEAGHAVVWTLLGVPVDRIARNAVEGLGASTHPHGDDHPLHGLLVGLAAGHVAETRYLTKANLHTPERAWAIERHAVTDQRTADYLCRKYLSHPMSYGTGEGANDWGQASAIADLMISAAWGRIARLADALIRAWEEGETVMPGRLIRQLVLS